MPEERHASPLVPRLGTHNPLTELSQTPLAVNTARQPCGGEPLQRGRHSSREKPLVNTSRELKNSKQLEIVI